MPEHIPKHIIDLSINDTTGNLELSDHGYTQVGWLGGILWRIKDPRIDSFRFESKPGSTHNIFTSRAERDYDTTLHLTVSFLVFHDWDYAIYWKDKATHTEHRLDPKIAVKPHFAPALLVLVIITVAMVKPFRNRIISFFKGKNKTHR